MFEDRRGASHRDRNQPFPTGKRFAFIRESTAIAQRARETLVAPTLARCFTPELKINWRDGVLMHRRHFDDTQLPRRQLVLGIELAQRVDRVAEKFEPHRSFSARRPNVDDAAAHRELTDT